MHGLVMRLVQKEKQVVQLQAEVDRLKAQNPSSESREADERSRREKEKERDRAKWAKVAEESVDLKAKVGMIHLPVQVVDILSSALDIRAGWCTRCQEQGNHLSQTRLGVGILSVSIKRLRASPERLFHQRIQRGRVGFGCGADCKPNNRESDEERRRDRIAHEGSRRTCSPIK